VLIFREPPEILVEDAGKIIGAPQAFEHNLKHNSFPETDRKIPGGRREDSLDSDINNEI